MKQVNDGIVLYRALSDLARRYQLRSRDEICCYSLTVSQCHALQLLSDKGPLASSEIAVGLGLDLSSTSRLIDQLVRKKLATRRRGEQDARVREIGITEAGGRLIGRIEEDFARFLAGALAEFPAAVKETIPAVIRKLAIVLECGDSSSEERVPMGKKRKTVSG